MSATETFGAICVLYVLGAAVDFLATGSCMTPIIVGVVLAFLAVLTNRLEQ